MEKYIDTNNYYLSKYFNREFLRDYTSTWIFYDKEEIIKTEFFFNDQMNVYSFLWEYSDNIFLKKIDEWKRAFRRNKIDIPPSVKLYKKDYTYPKRKVYLDIIETDFSMIDEIFENITAYNSAEHLAQIVVKNNACFSDFNLNFLENIDSVIRYKEYLKILDSDLIHAVILNGYHNRGELIKIFVHKREEKITSNENILHWNVFENTFVARSFSWE